MGRASSSKKVARAQRTATAPGASKNWLWPAVVVGVVTLGLLLIIVSRESRPEPEPPLLGDHWHAAYGINICGRWEPPYDDVQPDVNGIHSHGDGLIHIHPHGTRYTGDGANLGVFAEQVGFEVTDDSITVQGGRTVSNGDDCEGEDGIVRLAVWADAGDEEPEIITEGIAGYAPQDGEVVTVAFLPDDAEIPQPPSVGNRPVDLDPAQGGATTTPPAPETTDPTAADDGDVGGADDGDGDTTPTTEGDAPETTETTAAP